MKKNCKFICLLVSLMMFLNLFVGCSQTATTEKEPSTRASSEQKSTKKDEVVTINFLTYRGDDKKVNDELIGLFEEENPNIKVNVEYTPGGQEHYQLLKARAIVDELDVYCNDWGAPHSEMVNAGYALDLTGQDFLNNYQPSALEAGEIDGKVYGMSQAQSTFVTYYNKAIFEQYNLTPPTTWDELMVISEQLKGEGVSPFVLGISAQWLAMNAFYQVMASVDPVNTPQALAKLEKGEITLHDEPFKTTAELCRSITDKGYLMKGSAATDPNVAASLLVQGKAAMAIEGTWRIGTYLENEDFEFGMFIIRAPEGEATHIVWPNQLHVVNAKSKRLDESLKFMEFLSRPEIAAKYSNGTSQLPVVKGVESDNEKLNEVVKLINNSTPVINPSIAARNNEIATIVWDYFLRSFLDEELDAVAKDVQQRIDAARQ